MKDALKGLIGFRKFVYGIIFLSISLALLLSGHVSGADWIKYNSSVAIAFFSTNIGEHIIKIGKEYLQSKITRDVLDKIKP